MSSANGYHGVLLDVDLSSGKIDKRALDLEDLRKYIGGRGLGMKLLWDVLPGPGVDACSPENPLLFMPGPFDGLPLPSASRTCVVTKSPATSPLESPYEHASTLSYSNMGGFIAPEIRFAGYDGIMVRGRADHPVYLYINDDRVEIRDARKFWGMGTDEFDRAFTEELEDRRFQTCYIGPAGENQVAYASIMNTAARAAGRGGTGCVMGSKNLKAMAVRGSGQPDVADRKRFLELLEESRACFGESEALSGMRRYGTSVVSVGNSERGLLTTKNYREGSFENVNQISGFVAKREYWKRDFACFVCPLACKKSGVVPSGPHKGMVHDGPEYEPQAMLGSNLMVDELPGLLKSIYMVDDLGLDAISAGNVIGFLMEAYDKRLVDRDFLDGIDLKWGNLDAIHKMLRKIAYREGVGDAASKGVKHLAELIGKDSRKFAIHSKGLEFAAWNCHTDTGWALCYATATRGASHMSGHDPRQQDGKALYDSTGVCVFVQWGTEGKYSHEKMADILRAITGWDWTEEEYWKAGERISNLEKCFNYREGFRRHDDVVADRFFEEPYTVGPKKGAVLDRQEFEEMKTAYYKERGWDPETTCPSAEKLKSLGLEFTTIT